MGVDVFAHLFLEEWDGSAWSPVKLVARRKDFRTASLSRGVAELLLPYKEMGDVAYRALGDFAAQQFGLKKKAKRSRGLPKDLSAELRARYDAAREDAIAMLEELSEEYADTMSLAEGWLTAEELSKVDWERPWEPGEPAYRELLGPTFFAQIARVRALSAERTLRLIFWFTV